MGQEVVYLHQGCMQPRKHPPHRPRAVSFKVDHRRGSRQEEEEDILGSSSMRWVCLDNTPHGISSQMATCSTMRLPRWECNLAGALSLPDKNT